MKEVILSEGHNDTIFLRELLTTKVCVPATKILSFDQKTKEKHKNREAIQQRYFERLLQGYEDFDVLIKSEGGKSKIIAVTASQLPYLCEQKCRPLMLIDLDNDSIVPPLKKTTGHFIRELKQGIEARFKNHQVVLNDVFVDKNKEAELRMVEIHHGKTQKIYGKIFVVAFYRNMEKETGIDSKKDADAEKLKKAKKFIQNSTIHKLFSMALT